MKMLDFFYDNMFMLHKHGKLDRCIENCEIELKKLELTPFHSIIGRDLLKNKEEAKDFIISFAKEALKKIKLKSIYVEMNGFDINTDDWHFDLFGYDNYQSLDDPDWLSGWQYEPEPYRHPTLYGYEMLQEAYAKYYGVDKYKNAIALTNDLITLRFQELIREACKETRKETEILNKIPVVSSAHDFDYFYVSK